MIKNLETIFFIIENYMRDIPEKNLNYISHLMFDVFEKYPRENEDNVIVRALATAIYNNINNFLILRDLDY